MCLASARGSFQSLVPCTPPVPGQGARRLHVREHGASPIPPISPGPVAGPETRVTSTRLSETYPMPNNPEPAAATGLPMSDAAEIAEPKTDLLDIQDELDEADLL